MDLWDTIAQFWPPGWGGLFAFVAGATASAATNGWRQFGVLIGLALLLSFPLEWLGSSLGFLTFAGQSHIWQFADGWQARAHPATTASAALVVLSLGVMAWKSFLAPRDAAAEELRRAHWALLWAASQLLLALTTCAIHLGTISLVPASVPGLVATFLLPGIAQIYWIAVLWPAASPLTQMCAFWLCLFVVWLMALRMSGVWRTTVAAPRPSVPRMPPVWPPRRPTATG